MKEQPVPRAAAGEKEGQQATQGKYDFGAKSIICNLSLAKQSNAHARAHLSILGLLVRSDLSRTLLSEVSYTLTHRVRSVAFACLLGRRTACPCRTARCMARARRPAPSRAVLRSRSVLPQSCSHYSFKTAPCVSHGPLCGERELLIKSSP